MVQDIHFEIILDLQRHGSNHVRNIATNIQRSHVDVLRKLKDLENITEYRTQGRNKIFSLTDSIEARNHLLMAELYKANMTMQRYPKLRVIFDEITRRIEAPMVLLFGSYATGSARRESDIDILIETQDRAARERVKRVSRRISPKIGRFDPESRLGREIIRDHVIITGAERFLALSAQAQGRGGDTADRTF